MKMTLKEFFDGMLTETWNLLESGHPYAAFWIMMPMIEFMGICMDENAQFQSKNGSEKLFNRALQLKGLKKYKKVGLYKLLRCGLLHAMMPNSSVKVSGAGEDVIGSGNVIIRGKALLSNVERAWNDLQTGGKCKKDLNRRMFVVEDVETGAAEMISVSGVTSNRITK